MAHTCLEGVVGMSERLILDARSGLGMVRFQCYQSFDFAVSRLVWVWMGVDE